MQLFINFLLLHFFNPVYPRQRIICTIPSSFHPNPIFYFCWKQKCFNTNFQIWMTISARMRSYVNILIFSSHQSTNHFYISRFYIRLRQKTFFKYGAISFFISDIVVFFLSIHHTFYLIFIISPF